MARNVLLSYHLLGIARTSVNGTPTEFAALFYQIAFIARNMKAAADFFDGRQSSWHYQMLDSMISTYVNKNINHTKKPRIRSVVENDRKTIIEVVYCYKKGNVIYLERMKLDLKKVEGVWVI